MCSIVENESLFICSICDYKSSRKNNYDRHILSRIHRNSIEKGAKTRVEYCEKCNYKCNSKYSWEKHLSTAKHKLTENVAKNEQPLQTHKCCFCKKDYDKYNSMWYHMKRCKENKSEKCSLGADNKNEPNTVINDVKPNVVTGDTSSILLATILKELMEQNKELKHLIVNQPTTVANQNNYLITNNGTVNNNKLNLNIFLNEECKDAINITDYVENIQLRLEDLEETAKLGYTDGITKIINDHVKATGVRSRPFHCMDSKREIVYVKDNNVWEKENSDKPRMKRMISNVIHKNLQQLTKWQEKYPECLDTTHLKSDEYLNIMIEANGGKQREKKEEQILKNILKEVIVNNTTE